MHTRTKSDVEKAISKIPGSKTIVVHPELYQRLVYEKAALTILWQQPSYKRPKGAPSTATFADVIAENINRANHFAQLVSTIIRLHPELKPIIEEVGRQDPEYYKLVEPMLYFIKPILSSEHPFGKTKIEVKE